MGALGRVHGNGDLELALTIRTFAIAGGRLHLWVGGGIVWDSEPEDEVEESLTKAAPLLDAIGAPLQRAARARAEPVGGRGR
jgi:anthranilate/para-aminobenzoate synthase component I